MVQLVHERARMEPKSICKILTNKTNNQKEYRKSDTQKIILSSPLEKPIQEFFKNTIFLHLFRYTSILNLFRFTRYS